MSVFNSIRQVVLTKLFKWILNPLFLSDTLGSFIRGFFKYLGGFITGLGIAGVSAEMVSDWVTTTTAIALGVGTWFIGQVVSWVAKFINKPTDSLPTPE